MSKKQRGTKPSRILKRSGIKKIRPVRYSTENPRNLGEPKRREAFLSKYWWRPASGADGLPQDPEAKQVRIDKFFAAMTDFSDVRDSDNIFTEGRVIDNDDIEYTSMRIATAIDKLHQSGLCVPYIADPTVREAVLKGKKVWRVDEERNLTPAQREDAIVEHLKHYKKACLDAIDHDKELDLLFVAAPITAGKRRDANAKSNRTRKKRYLPSGADIPQAKPTENSQTVKTDSYFDGSNLNAQPMQAMQLWTNPMPLINPTAASLRDAASSKLSNQGFHVGLEDGAQLHPVSPAFGGVVGQLSQSIMPATNMPLYSSSDYHTDLGLNNFGTLPGAGYDWLLDPDGYFSWGSVVFDNSKLCMN